MDVTWFWYCVKGKSEFRGWSEKNWRIEPSSCSWGNNAQEKGRKHVKILEAFKASSTHVQNSTMCVYTLEELYRQASILPFPVRFCNDCPGWGSRSGLERGQDWWITLSPYPILPPSSNPGGFTLGFWNLHHELVGTDLSCPFDQAAVLVKVRGKIPSNLLLNMPLHWI